MAVRASKRSVGDERERFHGNSVWFVTWVDSDSHHAALRRLSVFRALVASVGPAVS